MRTINSAIFCAMVMFCCSSALSSSRLGYINYGAFALSDEININRSRYLRVGYLPIGSLVEYDSEYTLNITNYSGLEETKEIYSRVSRSSIGFTGHVLSSLITPLGDQKILLPLKYGMLVGGLTGRNSKERRGLTRAMNPGESTPAYIVDEHAENYEVEIKYTEIDGEGNYLLKNSTDPEGLNSGPSIKSVIGLIPRSAVTRGFFKYMDPQANEGFPRISSNSLFNPSSDILIRIKDFVDNNRRTRGIKKAYEYIQKVGERECILSGSIDTSVEVSIGLILSGSIGFNIELPVLQEGMITEIKEVSIDKGQRNTDVYKQVKLVECVNRIAYRMQRLSLVGSNTDAGHLHVRLIDLPDSLQKNWVSVQRDRSMKMINIRGLGDYMAFMKFLEEIQSDFLLSLPQGERLFMKHYLLREVANFDTPR